MIMKSHRREARSLNAHKDACELFSYAIRCEKDDAADAERWGASHGRYKKIRRSHRELIVELSRDLDKENDMGLR